MLGKGMQKTWNVFQNGANMGAKINENPHQNDVRFLMRKRVRGHPPRPRPGDGRGGGAPPPYYGLSDSNKPDDPPLLRFIRQ